ncbi:MAG: hypothetical protein ACYC6L_01835 [Anaerolineae bacterium]
MRLSKAWIVASKDFKTFSRKRNILYTMVYLEVIVSIGLPILTRVIANKAAASAFLPSFINAFSF